MKLFTTVFLLLNSTLLMANEIQIYCELDSSRFKNKFGMVGVLNSDDGTNLNGRFTIDFKERGKASKIVPGIFESNGTVEGMEFDELGKSQVIRIDFTKETSKIDYMKIKLNSRRSNSTLLKLNDGTRYYSRCISK